MSVPFAFNPTITKPANWARMMQDNLMNVDDTSDANKPTSDATQEQLDQKLNKTDAVVINSISVAASGEPVQFEITAGTTNTRIRCLDDHVLRLRIIDDNADSFCIQNEGGATDYWCIDTLDNTIIHSTNRQVNSQPIRSGVSLSGTQNLAMDTVFSTFELDTFTAAFDLTLTDFYAGKEAKFNCNGGTFKVKMPGAEDIMLFIAGSYESDYQMTAGAGGLQLRCYHNPNTAAGTTQPLLLVSVIECL